jgi:hypothetical protein
MSPVKAFVTAVVACTLVVANFDSSDDSDVDVLTPASHMMAFGTPDVFPLGASITPVDRDPQPDDEWLYDEPWKLDAESVVEAEHLQFQMLPGPSVTAYRQWLKPTGELTLPLSGSSLINAGRFAPGYPLMMNHKLLVMDLVLSGAMQHAVPEFESIAGFEDFFGSYSGALIIPIDNGVIIGLPMENMSLPPTMTSPDVDSLHLLLNEQFLLEIPLQPPGKQPSEATFPERLRTWERWEPWDPLNSP